MSTLFYWGDLEPEPGQPRFAADSPPIPRRPPPDVVVEWALKAGLKLKGHTLFWHRHLPPWLPTDDPDALFALLDRRMEQIAARYGDRITCWDVVNEALRRSFVRRFPVDYVYTCFQMARNYFPEGTMFMHNEGTPESWRPQDFRGELTPYYLLAQNLLLRNVPLGGLGLQY